jgi:hypothetical protein
MKAFALAMALVAFAGPCHASDELTPEKRRDLEAMLELTRALDLGKQMATHSASQMTQMLKQQRQDIPARVLDALPEEIGKVFEEHMPQLKEMMVHLYSRHFTTAEVKEMLRFYQSDLGKKTIQVMPQLAREGMELGQRWGQSVGPHLNERLRARFEREGIKL